MSEKFLQDITPREYQKKIFETCFEKNCLVVLPTGLGKTLIALMLTIERMKEFPGEKAIFLAPTKPLAEQHLNYFKKHLPELFGDLQLFTGSVNAEKRKEIWRTADIIFSTPQCIANDIKNRLYDLKGVCLLIEDEAHRCLKNYDYNYVAQEYKEQAMNQRIVGLTASPGSNRKKIKDICKNLSVEDVEIRTRDSDDVKKYLQELEFEKIMLDLPKDFEKMRDVLKKIFNDYIHELKSRKLLFGFSSKTELIKLQKKISFSLSKGNKNFNYLLGASACAQAIKIQYALELLETQTLGSFNRYLKELKNQALKKQSKGVVKLVSKNEFGFVLKKSGELLENSREHPKIQTIIDIVEKEKSRNENSKIILFTQFRETARIISKRLNKTEDLNAEVFVGQAKKKNLGMNQREQKKKIEEFSRGEIDVLCATCIGEEGLDIPEVNAVIFYEPVSSAIRAIQRAGRTARLMKGKLIILVTRKTRDEVSYYISRKREKNMHSIMHTIKNEMAGEYLKKSEQETLI